MQKTLRFYLSFLLLAAGLTVFGQDKALPVDSTVRIGTLSNGLTYYIRFNDFHKGQANFYIAQKVGSVQEEEEQRGLAHFLEHMCFNGTTHFPDNRLREYLESIGVKFGTNLNAYTSFDQTVYNIDNVPVTVAGALDSCLMILHDWSCDLTLDDAEIDKERGVIHEEWRTRRSPIMRMYDDVLPVLLKDSKYAYRMPIGLMSVVDNFSYQTLRDYYHKWYRPDLQGIIVVGDVDVDVVEQKIKALFGPVRLPENPAERVYYEVPDNVEPLIAVAKDKEQEQLQAMISFKHDVYPADRKNTEAYFKSTLVEYFSTSMLNNRFSELLHQVDPPFQAAKSDDGNYLVAKTKDAFSVSFASATEGFSKAFGAVLEELERVRRYGLTQGEFDRMILDYKDKLENYYLERNKLENKSFVKDYLNNFLDNSPVMSREQEYILTNRVLSEITLDDLNSCFSGWLTGTENIAMVVFSPDKDGVAVPEVADIRAQLDASGKAEVAPYVDKMPEGDLMDFEPEAGKVVKTGKGKFGSTIWNLSNGARVILKPTDLKENQIKMMAISPGGTSMYDDDEIINLTLMSNVVALGGLGNFNSVQLDKVLSGKSASVRSTVATLREGMVGYSTPKDFETMMQLIYLRFTAPRKDSVAYNSFMTRMKVKLEGEEKDPETALSDSLLIGMFDHHPRALSLKPEHLDEVDYDRCMEIYKERFADAGDFTFYLVGNFDPDSIRPDVEKYLGGLPSLHGHEKYIDRHKDLRRGKYENHFTKEMKTPKASVVAIYHAPCKANIKSELEMSFLTQVLRMIYTAEIREKEGGTYGVSVKGGVVRDTKEYAHLQISFTTDPERREDLSKLAISLFEKLAKEGPSPEMVEKVRRYMQKKHQEDLIDNSYWMGVLTACYWENEDEHTHYEKILDKLSVKDIRRFAENILKSGNLIEVSMTGVE